MICDLSAFYGGVTNVAQWCKTVICSQSRSHAIAVGLRHYSLWGMPVVTLKTHAPSEDQSQQRKDHHQNRNDLWSFSLLWWRDQCGAVMQDGYLFSESIARNIAVDDVKESLVINRLFDLRQQKYPKNIFSGRAYKWVSQQRIQGLLRQHVKYIANSFYGIYWKRDIPFQ